jgi:hypothetical protein
MQDDQLCAQKVINHITAEIKAGRKTGDLSIYTLCSRNIFESMLYGQYSPSYPVVLEAVKHHFKHKVAISVDDRFTYESTT